MDKIIEDINERIETILDNYPDGKVKEAMLYSLKAGGKRIRPLIVLQVIKAYGKNYQDYLDVACALEMIHTYSLIHDDLPGMDNDDMRRGMPTCHIKYGEAIAILAGDGLLNEAVNIVLNTSLNNTLKVNVLSTIYQASGISGMIYGQELDIENEDKDIKIPALNDIHHYKTGKLLACAFKLGGILSESIDLDVLEEIGYKIGLAFQIQDDILDVTADEVTLGKPVGSDESNHKSTYVTLLGIDKSQEVVNDLFNEAIGFVNTLNINHQLIIDIINKLWKRVN